MTDLVGRSVLVAGATGGLGLLVAQLLAERGAALTLTARTPARLAVVAADLGATQLAVDLRERGAADRVVDAALAAHGRLDGVVFVAGVVAFGPAVQVEDAVLDELFWLNVLAPVRLLRAAHPALSASAEQGATRSS